MKINFIIKVLLALNLLHWPSILLHFNYFTFTFIKNPLIILTILFAILYAYQFIWPFLLMGTIMMLIGINYIIINDLFFHSYLLKAVFFTFICAALMKDPSIIYSINKFALFLCTFLSIQALIVYTLHSFGYQLNYGPIDFVGADRLIEFNIFYGSKMIQGYLRSISYFTESNRFGYFLTPSLFMSIYYTRKNIIFLSSTVIIALAMLTTFSVATFTSVCIGLLIYFRKTGKLDRLIILSIFLTPFIYLIFIGNFEFFSFMFDKAGSVEDRLLGIINRIFIIIHNPYGIPEGTLPISGIIEGTSSTNTLLYWAQTGGIQTVLIFIPLLYLWMKSILKLIKSNNQYFISIGCGSFCFFLQQSFYGTYFEYYFMILMAIISVLAINNHKEEIKSAPKVDFIY